MISIKRGFTLLELMVVICMIALIIAALATSLTSAQERARTEKARSEVKAIAQAILAYENFDRSNELPTMENRDADQSALGFLIGQGGNAESGGMQTGFMFPNFYRLSEEERQ